MKEFYQTFINNVQIVDFCYKLNDTNYSRMVTSISVRGVYTILTSNFLNISPSCLLLLLGHNFLAWGQQIILLGFHILKLMAHLFSCFKELFVWLNPLLNKTTQYGNSEWQLCHIAIYTFRKGFRRTILFWHIPFTFKSSFRFTALLLCFNLDNLEEFQTEKKKKIMFILLF